MNETNVEKMKNYPYLLWLAPPRVSTPGIRTDLAKQCDSYEALIADPTVDNYYTFMKELQDKGLCKNALTADGSLARLDSIFNHAFGVTGTCLQENGKWIFSKASQAGVLCQAVCRGPAGSRFPDQHLGCHGAALV